MDKEDYYPECRWVSRLVMLRLNDLADDCATLACYKHHKEFDGAAIRRRFFAELVKRCLQKIFVGLDDNYGFIREFAGILDELRAGYQIQGHGDGDE